MLQRFVSKRDLWLSAVLWVVILVLAFTAWDAQRASLASGEQLLVTTISIAAAALIAWMWFGTCYEVGGGRLFIRAGPFRWQIDLDEITSVTRTRAAWSSPALSLDRLRIDYGNGKWVMVSPERPDAFIAALRPTE